MINRLWLAVVSLLAVIVSVGLAHAAENASPGGQGLRQIDVFTSGTEGYHTYRIPAIVLTNEGTLLAFCEGRKTSRRDHGDLDLVLRRSTDDGKTWQPMQLVYEEGGTAEITIGNPCPVHDAATGTLWLLFTRNNEAVLATASDDGISCT
jgi:sialidase-1